MGRSRQGWGWGRQGWGGGAIGMGKVGGEERMVTGKHLGYTNNTNSIILHKFPRKHKTSGLGVGVGGWNQMVSGTHP